MDAHHEVRLPFVPSQMQDRPFSKGCFMKGDAVVDTGYGMLYVQKYPRFLYIALKRDAGAARSTGYAFRQLGARHRVG